MEKENIENMLNKFKIVIRNDLDYLLRTQNCKDLLSYITDLQQENQSLKKQLEETKTNYEQEKYIVDKQTRQLTDEYKNTENQTNKVDELKNQQKEFIEYLENEINKIKDVKYSLTIEIQKTIFEEILSKFKEIIGGKDENI